MVLTPWLRLLCFGAEVVGQKELQRPFLNLGPHVLDDSFQGAAADLDRYRQGNLRNGQDRKWIKPLIDCAADEGSYQSADDRIYSFQIDLSNIQRAKDGLLRRIE